MKLNHINGEWVNAEAVTLNVNPSDIKDIIGEYSTGSKDDVNRAVGAAKAALSSWNNIGIQKRSDILDSIGSRILAEKERLGDLLAREEGKTLPEAIGEVHRAGSIFKYYAAEALRLSGDFMESVRPGIDITVTREPVGVVGIITPWNFPIAIPAWKIAPALAYGNTVVFKPAELVPGSAHALAEIIVGAGVPSGVFNLVMGSGSSVGTAIVNHRDVSAVTFTGSVQTGGEIAGNAISRMARVQTEMGGKNPLVVVDDADLDVAVDCALQGAFFSTGQRCTASSRLIVTAEIHDRFVEALTEKTAALRVGDARNPDTQIGPVIDQNQLDQNLNYIAIGKSEGAKLVCGGDQVQRDAEGFYMQPALFVSANNNMRISREEIFGPVACVIKVDNYEEALSVANDTEFGLSSGICTTSLKNASNFKQNARAGMVMVNAPTAGVDYHVPFGGIKGSSYGTREQGTFAKEFYTTVKTAYTAT